MGYVPANTGDEESIPGLGRSPGVEDGNPLQCYCLENSMDRGAWQATAHGVAKSQTWLSDCTHTRTHTHTHTHTVPLQCCVSFCCKQSESAIHIHPSTPPSISFLFRSPQIIEQAPCAIVVYVCQSQSPNSCHPLFPPWYPYICSLCLSLFLPWK